MTDNYEVRDVIDKETLSTVKSVGDTYKYGFSTDIETEYAPLGLNEDIVILVISLLNNLGYAGLVRLDSSPCLAFLCPAMFCMDLPGSYLDNIYKRYIF